MGLDKRKTILEQFKSGSLSREAAIAAIEAEIAKLDSLQSGSVEQNIAAQDTVSKLRLELMQLQRDDQQKPLEVKESLAEVLAESETPEGFGTGPDFFKKI